jgi:UDP-GlcNAc:undecaprenyl-phosphate GlcNAc-1-phosphate transferase
MPHIDSILVSFFFTFIFIKVLSLYAPRVGLIDKPNKRKNHTGNVPLVGGVAIFIAFTSACLLSPKSLSEWRLLFFCLLPLIVVGIMDDSGDISVMIRVLVQIAAAIIMVYYADAKVTNIGDIFGLGNELYLGYASSFFTILFVVGIINSLNLIDGIDGLCSAISITTLLGIIIIIKLKGLDVSIAIISYFIISLLAFLSVNLGVLEKKIPKVFLGDAGTTMIGFFLVWNLIKYSQDVTVFKPITAVWLLAIPIIDTVSVMILRIKAKGSPFTADRRHIHHIIISCGFSKNQTLLLLLVLNFVFFLAAILSEIYHIREFTMFIAFVVIFVIYNLFVSSIEKNKY